MSIELRRTPSRGHGPLVVALASILFDCGAAKEPIATIARTFGEPSRAASASSHPNVTFTTIDVPGSLATIGADITATGDVVGRYCVDQCQDITGNWHGFLLSEGEFTSIDFSGAFHTNATGLNPRGDIVGRYRDVVDGPFHGFLLSEDEFTAIDFPGAFSTRAYGITPGGETIVGDYCTDPGCIRPAAGHWHGFLLSRGQFNSFDFPGAIFTQVWRINPAGQIVGRYRGADGRFHMFLLSKDNFTPIDFPGAANTGGDAGGINPRGDIVGTYADTRGNIHGFLRGSEERGEDEE